jgi:hypothetical protein
MVLLNSYRQVIGCHFLTDAIYFGFSADSWDQT